MCILAFKFGYFPLSSYSALLIKEINTAWKWPRHSSSPKPKISSLTGQVFYFLRNITKTVRKGKKFTKTVRKGQKFTKTVRKRKKLNNNKIIIMEISRDFNLINFQRSKIFQTTCYDILYEFIDFRKKIRKCI